jgi:chromosome segregation ATPase
MGEGGQSVLEQPTAEPTGDADAMQRQAEASIEQVEGDLKRMTTFNAEVRRSLDESDRAKIDVQHALGYFRRQQELHQDERDTARARVVRIEEEVATLQRKIQNLEADKKALASDKSTLLESNRKMIGQLNSMFSFGQAVQTGLAFRGLDVNATK